MEARTKPKTIRARVSGGMLEPLEPVELQEGNEVLVTIVRTLRPAGKGDPLDETFGAWKGLIDAEKLKADIYADRLISTRLEPRL